MPHDAFKLSNFSEHNLYEALSNQRFSVAEVRSHDRATYLFRYLKDINAKTLIVELCYTDGDYLDDFASYYVKCYEQYERRCKRLHFFSYELTEEIFLKMVQGNLDQQEYEKIRKSYLGFVVARPLPNAIVGRTVLKTYDSDGGRRNYTCIRNYSANLFGIDLSVESLAFQEQDSVLAACATVALWCSFHKTSILFATPLPTPAVITRVANQVVHYARPIPSHGLNIQQICNAIRNVGLEPEVVVVDKNVALPSLIYGHLKMGLPVILIVQVEGMALHAITLTGYSIKNERVHGLEVAGGESCIPMPGLRINEFYGHDDQIGPFSRIEVKPSTTVDKKIYPVAFEGSWVDKDTGRRLTLYPEAVVVPVYHKIRVTFIDVQKWLTRLNEVLMLIFGPDAKIEWDLHLIMSNSFKKMMQKSALEKNELEKLLLKHHPRFIWRSTLKLNGADLFDLLADATDMAPSFPIYYTIWQFNDFKIALHNTLNAPALRDVLLEMLGKRFWEFLKNETIK